MKSRVRAERSLRAQAAYPTTSHHTGIYSDAAEAHGRLNSSPAGATDSRRPPRWLLPRRSLFFASGACA